VPVIRMGEKLANPEVIEFGKKLIAIKPQIETNLHALREDAVARRIEAAKKEPPVERGAPLPRIGPIIALFDPARVADALIRGGKPRTDPKRAGDVAWFGVDPQAEVGVELVLGAPPEGQATLDRRLAIDSGVVFIGPPEASDGPRLGTVRVDPFSTALDEQAARGAFRRLSPGLYLVRAHRTAEGGVRVHLESVSAFSPDPDVGAVLPEEHGA